MTEETFVIIKPDAVKGGHVGAILALYEESDLRIKRLDMRTITGEFADEHYAEHLDKGFYPALREFMTSGPLVAVLLEGHDAIACAREINGPTNPADAEVGTVRAAFGTSVRENAVHASDSTESAAAETALWFPTS